MHTALGSILSGTGTKEVVLMSLMTALGVEAGGPGFQGHLWLPSNSEELLERMKSRCQACLGYKVSRPDQAVIVTP